MISNKSAIWLFIAATVVLFGVIPQFDQQLGLILNYWDLFVGFLFFFWFATFFIVVWSYGIILLMLDRHHESTNIIIGITYIFLTKEARVVAHDFYKFNFFKGDEK